MKNVNRILIVVILVVVVGGVVSYRQGYKTADNSVDFYFETENAEKETYVYISGTNEENEYAIVNIPSEYYWYPVGTRKRLGVVRGIYEGAFQDYTNLKKVELPNTIEEIRLNAFSGCIKLKTVVFHGTEQQWKQVKIEEGNDVLSRVKIIFEKNNK